MANVIILSTLFLWNLFLHPYYVSIWDLAVNNQTQTVQLTTKVFLDDFEDGLNTMHGTQKWEWKSKDSTVQKQLDSMVVAYVNASTLFLVDGKKLELNFLGKEVELDVCYLYFESPKWNSAPKELEIKNYFLIKEISDQMNIVHVTFNGNKKSFLMHKSETSVSLKLN